MKNKSKNKVVVVHLGKKEKSGKQIVKKLQQYDIDVKEVNIMKDTDKLESFFEIDVLIVNIGLTSFDYDDFLSKIFESNLKIIINEAELTNQLTGYERQSWERHLLNKVDSKYELLPLNKDVLAESKLKLDLKLFGIKDVWLLAASIGGPESIQDFLTCFSGEEPILLIITQHIDQQFITNFANQLNANCKLSVTIPVSGSTFKSGDCIVYPTEEHLYFCQDGTINLKFLTKKHKFTPCIDEAGERLVENIKNVNMAIFSGMSTDGVNSAKLIKQNGGKVITQDEESCVLSTIISGVKKHIKTDFNGKPKSMANYIIKNLDTNL